MNEEYLYRRIQEALENIPDNFNVLEEQIDVQLQMEYFEYSQKLHKQENLRDLGPDAELLFDPELSQKEKRKILSLLAISADVKSFRTIEKYLKNPDPGMRDWTVLALQECRMLLQSTLLDEQQIYISSGLGGKGHCLRYFVVFLNHRGKRLSAMEKKLLRDELKYVVEKNEGELEEFTELIDYTTAVVILPLKAPLKDIFRGIIDECNQYGHFLEEDMVITNVKRLNATEIVEILNQQRNLPEEFSPEEEADEGDEE